MSGVQNRENFDRVAHAIGDDIVRMHDGFTRARDAARTVDIRMRGQLLGGLFDRGVQPFRGGQVAIGDIVCDGDKIGAGLSAPDEQQRHASLSGCLSLRP